MFRKKITAFTLIEVLLAITLSAIILSILYGVFLATLQAQREIELVQQKDRRVEGLFRRMMFELKSLPYFPSPHVSLIGIMGQSTVRQDRLEFITSSPPVYNVGKAFAVHEVGYFVQADDKGEYWLYRREEEGTDFNLTQGGLSKKIMGGIQNFEISYYSASQWTDQWQQNFLPESIKIKLALQKNFPLIQPATSDSSEETNPSDATLEEYEFLLNLPAGGGRP